MRKQLPSSQRDQNPSGKSPHAQDNSQLPETAV